MDGRKRSTTSRSDSTSYAPPDFDDPKDFPEIPDDMLLADIINEKPGESTGMEAVIIVDNLPANIQPGDRFEKLKVYLRKLMVQHTKCQPADIINEVLAVDENGTQGFAFFEFSKQEYAQKAVEKVNGVVMDKQHVLSVDLFTRFDEFANYDREWVEPEPRPYKDHGNLQHFMEDEDCVDEYVCIYDGIEQNRQMTVYRNTPVEPTVVQSREHWTEKKATWSPLGTYLTTYHARGIALWGGEEFKQINRFAHKDVGSALYSPKERYIVTIRQPQMFSGRDDESMVLWDVITSARKKDFSWDSRDPPLALKWSFDEDFYAMLGKNDTIAVYETKTLGLLGREPLSIPGLVDFAWSPAQNYMAYWVRSESDQKPARVGIFELPSKEDKCPKQVYHVIDCNFYWQKNGEYLAVKVHRFKGLKKVKKDATAQEKAAAAEFSPYAGTFSSLQIFTLTGRKEFPVETIEIKDKIIDLAWEPNGNKLVVLTVADSLTSASIYAARADKHIELTKKITLRQKADKISWSPMGQFVVLHTVQSGSSVGYLVFLDTETNVVLQNIEHFLLADVHWDPTGRYLAATTSGHNKKDNSYTLFGFQGRFLRTEKLDGLSSFAWRPRPPTLLSAEKQKEIRKNVKKYAAEFENRDRMQLTKASREVSDRRKAQMDEFENYIQSCQRYVEAGRQKLIDLRGGVDTEAMDDHPDDLVEEELEIIQNITTTIVD